VALRPRLTAGLPFAVLLVSACSLSIGLAGEGLEYVNEPRFAAKSAQSKETAETAVSSVSSRNLTT